jgi:hypothetical protein
MVNQIWSFANHGFIEENSNVCPLTPPPISDLQSTELR